MTEGERNSLYKEKEEEINRLIKQRRYKWRLNALAYISYDDISQIIRSHIYKKLHLYKPEKPFPQWCNKIISNQIFNEIRNNYGNVAPPCFGCVFNEGADRCRRTPSQTKCSECDLYKEWEQKKEKGYNLKLPQSIDADNFVEKHGSGFENDFDFEKSSRKLNQLLKKQLSSEKYFIYESGILANHLDGSIAKKLAITAREVKEKKEEIYSVAKKIVYKYEVVF